MPLESRIGPGRIAFSDRGMAFISSANSRKERGGGLGLVFLGAGVYLLSALGLGLLISTASETQQQAQFLAFFLLLLYLFLSGIFTPVESMPGWARALAELNPMKHCMALIRTVLFRGASLGQVWVELGALTGFAAIVLPLAVRLHSKTAA